MKLVAILLKHFNDKNLFKNKTTLDQHLNHPNQYSIKESIQIYRKHTITYGESNERIYRSYNSKKKRDVGAHRISVGAIEELNERITAHRMEIAAKAVKIAQYSCRKTTKDNDTKLDHSQLG